MPNNNRLKCVDCYKTYSSISCLSHHKKVCKKIPNIEQQLKKEKEERAKEREEYEKEKLEYEKKILECEKKHIEHEKEKMAAKENLLKLQPVFSLITIDGETKYSCNCCKKLYSTQQGLSRHLRSCNQKDMLVNSVAELNKQVDTLSKDKDIFANIAVTNSNTANMSVTMNKYLITKFNNK